MIRNHLDFLNADTLTWLLEPDNPAVRFFALHDLLDRPAADPRVSHARKAIAGYPPTRVILDKLSVPGYWDRHDDQHLRAHTVWVLLLADLGVNPALSPVSQACEWLLQTMQRDDGAFPSKHPVYGGVRPCTQGLITEALLRLGLATDPRVARAVEFAAGMEHECTYNADLPCAWGVVKLLRAMAAVPAYQRSSAVKTAIKRGVDLLLRYDLVQANYPHDRAISREWFRFGFPRGYQSDILETLGTLARLGSPPHSRLEGAIILVMDKRRPDGRWESESVSPVALEVGIDRPGTPSKWITLRASQVLKWWTTSTARTG